MATWYNSSIRRTCRIVRRCRCRARGAGGAACLVSVSCVALHRPNCASWVTQWGNRPAAPRAAGAAGPRARRHDPRRTTSHVVVERRARTRVATLHALDRRARRACRRRAAAGAYTIDNCLSTSLQHAARHAAFAWGHGPSIRPSMAAMRCSHVSSVGGRSHAGGWAVHMRSAAMLSANVKVNA